MMLRLLAVVFGFFSLAAQASSTTCNRFWQYAMDDKVKSNSDFWTEFGAVQNEPEEKLMALLEKYGVDVEGPPAGDAPALVLSHRQPSTSGRIIRHDFSARASKELEKLSPHLRKDFDEFISLTSIRGDFLKPLHDNPGRWQLKKLNAMGGGYSVRLNREYRVIFEVGADGEMIIEAISKTLSHGGH